MALLVGQTDRQPARYEHYVQALPCPTSGDLPPWSRAGGCLQSCHTGIWAGEALGALGWGWRVFGFSVEAARGRVGQFPTPEVTWRVGAVSVTPPERG